MRERPQNPGKPALFAWLKSLPAVLLTPVAIWMIFSFFQMEVGDDSINLLLYGGTIGPGGLVFHFIAYLAVGLPVFLRFYPHPSATIWKPGPAVCWGVILDSIVGALTFSPLVICFTAPYGFITAVMAWRQRPRMDTRIC